MTRNNAWEPAASSGARAPEFTPIPNEIFDELLPDLSGDELKVLVYIARSTAPKYHRDGVSLEHIVHGTVAADGRRLDPGSGVSHAKVVDALRSLRERGVITRTVLDDQVVVGEWPETTYRLRLRGEPLDSPQ